MKKNIRKEEIKNLLIKVPIELYTNINLKYLNEKLEDPNLNKNDFLITILKKGIAKIEEER